MPPQAQTGVVTSALPRARSIEIGLSAGEVPPGILLARRCEWNGGD